MCVKFHNDLNRFLLPAILLLAAIARFAALDSAPAAVFPDEAKNGNDGLYAVTHGDLKVFYPSNTGREGLFINLVGASVWALGNNRLGLRFWSAAIGTLTVWLIYCFATEVFNRTVGLWAAFFLATSFWHLLFSRIAFRAILVPALLLGAFYCLFRAWRQERAKLRWAILGGFVLGLGFYSYTSFRFAPLIVAGLLLLRRRWCLSTALWLATAFVTALPIGIYFLNHPDDFTSRARQVGIWRFDSPVRVFFEAYVKSAAMFHWKGDCLPRHNLTCEPQVPFVTGLLLLAGALIALAGIRRLDFRYGLLVIWTLVMLLPAALAWEGMPHALRTIGAIPPVFLLVALGADAIFRRLHGRRMLKAAFLTVVLAVSFFEYYRYFGIWLNHPATAQSMFLPLAEISEYLNALPESTARFVVMNEFGSFDPIDPDHPDMKVYTPAQVLIFLTHGHPQPVYLQIHEAFETTFPKGSVIVPLQIDPGVFEGIREHGFNIVEEPHASFVAGIVQ
jgi:4-amino-4-deoxy-L-arabinose transferase-like glycosyltransferase